MRNNHIMDQNVQGVLSTINVLQENGINYVGAGENLSDASEPYIIGDNGKKSDFMHVQNTNLQ